MNGTLEQTGTLTGILTIPVAAAASDTLSDVMYGISPTATVYNPNEELTECIGISGMNDIMLADAVSIGENAFKDCTALESVNAPNVEEIKASAFEGCSNLEEVDVVKLYTIGNNAFKGCTKLEDIDLSMVTSIGDNAFDMDYHNCSFTEIDLSECLSIGSEAFNRCEDLTTVVCPKVTTIGNEAFKDSGVTALNLPVIVTLGEGARTMKKLTSINIPLVTEIVKSAFNNNERLPVLRLPAVTTIGKEAFNRCDALEDIYLGHDAVVDLTKDEFDTDYNLFGWAMNARSVIIHVPAALLTDYQNNAKWTSAIAKAAEGDITVTFAGDYE